MGKLSSIFGGGKKFKGAGHRLGSASSSPEKSGKATQNGSQPPAASAPQQRALFQGRSHTASGAGGPPKPAAPKQTYSPTPVPRGVQEERSAPSQAIPSGGALREEPGIDGPAAVAVASEDLQLAVAQLDTGPSASSQVLSKVLANILRSPQEPKFRDIRLANPKIKEAIYDVEGALELLAACGFQMDAAEGSEDVHLILPMEEDLTQLKAAAYFVDRLQSQGRGDSSVSTSAPQPETPSPAVGNFHAAPTPAPASRQTPAPVEPCDRETTVLVPPKTDSGGGGVAEWVFERTPAELKAEMLSRQKKREQREMLMTRAMQEKLTAGRAVNYVSCLVRVRLPEGLLLQGHFKAGEGVAAVFDWISDCMADPSATYELIMPDRKALVTSMGTLRSANLLPSALLMMRMERPTPERTLTLKPEVMATMTP